MWRASGDKPSGAMAAKPSVDQDRQPAGGGAGLRGDPKLIVVPNDFRAKVGTKLVKDLFVGEALGTGLQARGTPWCLQAPSTSERMLWSGGCSEPGVRK